MTLALPITDDEGARIGTLHEIDAATAANADIAQLLTRWRAERRQWFLTQFEPTVDRTKRWLESAVVPDRTRVLFLVEDEAGEHVGTIGLLHLDQDPIELDNILRGKRQGHRDLMYWGLVAAVAWLFEHHSADGTNLCVLSTNERAISLYGRLGFEPATRYQLTRSEAPEGVSLLRGGPIEAGFNDLHLLEMRLSRNTFIRARGA
jgi:RimJ/RimL family protein N-acetyltransferase